MARRRRRRGLARVFVFITIVAVLGAGLFVAARWLLSPQFVTRQLAAAVKSATGRTLIVKGRPQIHFWPELSIRLKDVRLSNPPGFYKGDFLQAGEIDLAVAARPLLQRRLVVRRINIRRPKLTLLTSMKGKTNWDFDTSGKSGKNGWQSPPGQPAAQGFALKSIRLAPVIMEEGSVSYIDERSGVKFAASGVNLRLSLPTPEAPLTLKGSLVWKKEPVKFTLFLKAPARLITSGSAMETSVETPRIKAAYSGLISLRDGLDMAGRADASGPSLRGLMGWLGAGLPKGRGLGPFAVSGAIDLSPKAISLKKAALKLDGMTARGDVKVITGAHPKISAFLGVDRIDVNAYLAPEAGGKGARKARDAADWSDAPVSFAPLRGLDADLRLAANAIVYRKVRIGRSELTASLRKGVLDARLKKMAFYDGVASGRLVLDGSGKRPLIRGSLNAKSLNGARLLRDFAAMESLRGTLDVVLSLAASGRSQREMVSTLRGNAKVKFANGAIKGINIARLVRTVKTAIVNGWKKAPREKTDFAELSASFRIADGLARTNDLKMLGPLVRLSGAGEADLLRRKLDFRIEPKIVASLKGQGGKAQLTGLPVPIIVKGPWDNPKIYPDIKGILDDPKAAYANLRELAGQIGGKKGERIVGKAAAAVKKQKKKLLQKAEKTIGKKTMEKAKKAEKKARKLLKKLFQ